MNSEDECFVIGAGFGRTGTLSLKTAFEILGFNPCYHMKEVYPNKHWDQWSRLDNGEKIPLKSILGNYKATTDNPACLYWEEIMREYPNSKVVLGVRDPKKWLESCRATIFNVVDVDEFGFNILCFFFPSIRTFLKFCSNHLSKFFKNDYSDENCIKLFNEHIENVKQKCPKDRLLVFEAKQGWEPLCKFLGKEVPKVPFPHVNDSEGYKTRMKYASIFGYSLLVVASVAVLGISYYIKTRFF